MHTEFYIVGDFNLHLDTQSATTTTFNDILASFDTKQHVNFPTHIHGHWLDILITCSSCKNIQTPTVADGLSDHNTVIADLKVPTAPAVSKHNVFYRAIHSINIASFMTDIITSDLVTHPKEHVSDLYKQYRQIPKTLLDKHAPIKSKSMSQKPPAPWMIPEIIQSKLHHRYLERVWRKSRSSLDRSRYTRQCHLCNQQMSKAKSYYYENMVSNNSPTPKQLWKCINQSSHCVTLSQVILKTKSASYIQPSQITLQTHADSPQPNSQLTSFKPATTAEVRKIIMSSASKSCDLDPLLTVLLKACLDVLIKPMQCIILLRLISSRF